MLTHLTINNFMLIDHLDFQLKQGMTTITGETGTGKSVLLGALGLALGERPLGLGLTVPVNCTASPGKKIISK